MKVTFSVRNFYKRDGDQWLFRRLCADCGEVYVDSGVVGDEKSITQEMVRVRGDVNKTVKRAAEKLQSEGFYEPSLNEYSKVEVVVSFPGLSKEQAVELEWNVSDTLSEYTGYSGNGHPDYFESQMGVDGAKLTTYVFDAESAIADLPEWFANQLAHADVVATIETGPGRLTRIWPPQRDFRHAMRVIGQKG